VLPQKVPGQLKLTFERNAEINSEEGGGKAKPDGVAGVLVAYKKLSEPNTEWRYVYYTKLHELLVLSEEWHGETIHIKAAYYAHVTDPHEQLPWSEVHTVTLIKDVTDVTAAAAAELAAAKAAAEAKDAENAALKAELEALRNAKN
jgi:hypothetical protein